MGILSRCMVSAGPCLTVKLQKASPRDVCCKLLMFLKGRTQALCLSSILVTGMCYDVQHASEFGCLRSQLLHVDLHCVMWDLLMWSIDFLVVTLRFSSCGAWA